MTNKNTTSIPWYMVFDANAHQINGFLHAHHIVLAINVLPRDLPDEPVIS
jgi:hypothetical protein